MSTRISCDDIYIYIYNVYGVIMQDTLQTEMMRCVVYAIYVGSTNMNDKKIVM